MNFSLAETDVLVGREKEIDRIYTSLEQSILSHRGIAVSLAGGAGSGKTSTCKHVVQKLKKTNQFESLYFNAHKLKQRKDAYGLVWDFLKGSSLEEMNIRALDKMDTDIPQKITMFLSKAKGYYVIVIDELDFLKGGRDQTEIYEFFNWPQIGPCSVVGISNDVSLNDTLLPKISSRLDATERIIFLPYTYSQILEILHDRLKLTTQLETKFENVSVQFCAKKIAASSGDIRKGLAICQKSIQIQQDRMKMRSRGDDQSAKRKKLDRNPCVTIDDMVEAFSLLEKEDSYPLDELGYYEQVFLCCLVKSIRASREKDGYTSFENVIQRVQTFLKSKDRKYQQLTLSLLKPSFDSLYFMKIVGTKQTPGEIYPLVRLIVPQEVIESKLTDILKLL